MNENSNQSIPSSETTRLLGILQNNRALWDVLEGCEQLAIPNYYVGAGCITQTVWNSLGHDEPMHGISDIDFVYFDSDISYEKEDAIIKKVKARFASSPIEIDVKNEARVHLWYKEHFGHDIRPYVSVEDAIDSWPTTASAVGVRLEKGNLAVYAPFGLTDMFQGIVRPNKVQISQEVYEGKCKKWLAKWPTLTIIPW
jgi:uncharacterized protein